LFFETDKSAAGLTVAMKEARSVAETGSAVEEVTLAELMIGPKKLS